MPLSVMSFNVRYGTADDGSDRWEFRRHRALGLLAARRPDLLGVQEALAFQVEELKGLGYGALGAGRDDGASAGEHAAILYDPARLQPLASGTFWLSPTPEDVGSTGWGATLPRICTWATFRDLVTGRAFDHYNTHLDHVSQPARDAGVALILGRLAAREEARPAIVTGDFNAGEDNLVHERMRAAGFRDAFRVMHPDAPGAVTFNGWEPDPKGDKIDYVFVQGATRVLEAEIVRDRFDGRWASDHMPVTATVEF